MSIIATAGIEMKNTDLNNKTDSNDAFPKIYNYNYVL